jgi:hypothetical protein
MNYREYEYEYSKMVSDVEEVEVPEPTNPDISIVLNDLEEVERLWKRYECS